MPTFDIKFPVSKASRLWKSFKFEKRIGSRAPRDLRDQHHDSFTLLPHSASWTVSRADRILKKYIFEALPMQIEFCFCSTRLVDRTIAEGTKTRVQPCQIARKFVVMTYLSNPPTMTRSTTRLQPHCANVFVDLQPTKSCTNYICTSIHFSYLPQAKSIQAYV